MSGFKVELVKETVGVKLTLSPDTVDAIYNDVYSLSRDTPGGSESARLRWPFLFELYDELHGAGFCGDGSRP